MSDPDFELVVNGKRCRVEAPDPERLLDTLRWRLGLRGTKEGCRTGDCGACTVLVEGRPTLSCLTLVHEVEGAHVETIEGIGESPTGLRVRSAFEAASALQCGYCTPGFIVALTGLLSAGGPAPSAEALLEDLQGNLCRCTGYASIRRAVSRLAEESR